MGTILERFKVLSQKNGWKLDSDDYKEERRSYIVEQVITGFSGCFGGDSQDLSAWIKLCHTVRIQNAQALASVPECQIALRGTYVNLVDLVDAALDNRQIGIKRVYRSPKALAKYTLRTNKIFPKIEAVNEPMLSAFLIHVFSHGRRRGGGRRRKRKENAGSS